MWHDFSKEKPTKDGQYLTVIVFKSKHLDRVNKIYAVYNWTNNLLKTYPYVFEYMVGDYNYEGFYGYEEEGGGYEVKTITAWKEIEDYEV